MTEIEIIKEISELGYSVRLIAHGAILTVYNGNDKIAAGYKTTKQIKTIDSRYIFSESSERKLEKIRELLGQYIDS